MQRTRPSYLIVGLGNPGIEYAPTRHNIGFMVVDALATRRGLSWQHNSRLMDCTQWATHGRTIELVKPLTYMNLSGKAVLKRMQECGLGPQQVIVITDEYNFPTGKIHLRSGGSSGGHNGISSVIEELGTPNFWRLRCGIDRKFGPGELVEYVLHPFPKAESETVSQMIDDACAAIVEIIKAGPSLAMQRVNTPRNQKDSPAQDAQNQQA